MKNWHPILVVVLLAMARSPVVAGFDVTSWNLTTHLSDNSGQSTVIDSDDILHLSNPLIHTSHAEIGGSFTTAEYDYRWLEDIATGKFHTTLTHAIRGPEIRSVSTGMIFILPSEDLRISVAGLLNYSHTPGDLDSVNFSASVRNVATGAYSFLELRRGGNLYSLPSSGALSFQGDAVLSAGTLYRLLYVLDCDDGGDLLPTGILDASGYVNFAIEPVVPEPATLILCMPFAIVVLRHRRL